MTKKHTPGPWAFLDTGLVFAGENRLHIAQVATTGMGYQAAGNAALISAAPELLEALILVRDALDQYALPHKYTKMAEKVFGPQVRAAIAKATGEQA